MTSLKAKDQELLLHKTMVLLEPAPPYLLLHMKRFVSNQFFLEKNPTIVSAPLKNLKIKTHSQDSSAQTTHSYHLVASIIHEGQSVETGKFKVQVRRPIYEQEADGKGSEGVSKVNIE